jgi:predicted NBD/HSP70 family sugar kinase
LTRATIGNAVKELIDSGLVVEGADKPEAGRPGRPGSGVRLNPEGGYAIGIDLSSLAITAVLIDLNMQIVQRLSEPVAPKAADPDHLVNQITRLARRLVATARVDPTRVQGLCVSVPGLVDRNGRVVVAPFLHWRDVALRRLLSEHPDLPWPVTVCNDAVAFANAERTVSTERDAHNMLLILLSEGLGGAIVQRGQIFEGAHGYAGELGHMVMGAAPAAIESKTFETLAGIARFRPFLPPDRPLEEGVRWLASQAENSPALARAFDGWSDVLTAGMLNLIYLFDPERIVLSGPLSALFPRVKASVTQKLAKHLLHGFEPPSIDITRFGADGAAIGAASVVREQMFSLPQLERT